MVVLFQTETKGDRRSEFKFKYRGFLISVAYNIVCDTNDCEECLNDTYIGAWNSIPPSKPISLQAFLATIMRRTAIDCYKAKNRQKRVASELSVSLSYQILARKYNDR